MRLTEAMEEDTLDMAEEDIVEEGMATADEDEATSSGDCLAKEHGKL